MHPYCPTYLSVVHSLGSGQQLQVLLDAVRHSQQGVAALRHRRSRPGREGGMGGIEGSVDILEECGKSGVVRISGINN